jgi:hypothetical protein
MTPCNGFDTGEYMNSARLQAKADAADALIRAQEDLKAAEAARDAALIAAWEAEVTGIASILDVSRITAWRRTQKLIDANM